MKIIKFKKLIKNYDQNLLDNLRGFGKEDEFLKFWVPGTDDYQSFINLIDALVESKLYEVKIVFDKVLDKDNFLEKITKVLFNISKFKKNLTHEIEFEIQIDLDKYEQYSKSKINYSKQIREVSVDKTKIARIEKNNENLNLIHKKNLKKFSPKNFYSKEYENDENYYKEKINNITLFFLIKDNMVINAAHNSEKNSDIEKLINMFFELVIDKNIQEAADHSVIYLEEKIRTFDHKITSEGIILPRQGGEYFNVLNEVIRKIFFNYKEKNNLEFDVNRHYFEVSNNWKDLSEEKKLLKINLILDEIIRNSNILLKNSISVNKIENHYKINLNVDKIFSKLQNEKNILLEIETKFKRLDDTLEVFVDEILDQNKLRIKNSPQKI